jgi:nitrite reductase (NADH) large subunit
VRYVIIGNSAAGVVAAESIRSLDARGQITIVGHEPHHVYSRPLAAHLVAGELDEGAIRFRPADFYDRLGVQTRLGVRVIRLDVESRQVVLADGEDIAYDRLLLATGSVTRFPAVEGRDLPGVFDFWTLDDAKAVAGWARRCDSAVVVGAGLVGLQAAYGLHQAGLRVTLVDMLAQVLGRILDAGGAAVVQQVLEGRGVGVELGHALARIEGTADSGVAGVVLDDGWMVECGLVIRATGVAPNVALAEGTPILVNRGILVNRFLETSVPGVYAAGDVAENHDRRWVRPSSTPTGRMPSSRAGSPA